MKSPALDCRGLVGGLVEIYNQKQRSDMGGVMQDQLFKLLQTTGYRTGWGGQKE